LGKGPGSENTGFRVSPNPLALPINELVRKKSNFYLARCHNGHWATSFPILRRQTTKPSKYPWIHKKWSQRTHHGLVVPNALVLYSTEHNSPRRSFACNWDHTRSWAWLAKLNKRNLIKQNSYYIFLYMQIINTYFLLIYLLWLFYK
jgi:hypothetical protein